MSLVTAIYLVSVVNGFDGLLHLIQIIYVIGLFFFFMSIFVCDLDETKDFMDEYGNKLKLVTIAFAVSCLISVFIPTKNEMYAMLAVNQANELKLDETARKGIEVLNIKLDEIIAEAKKD